MNSLTDSLNYFLQPVALKAALSCQPGDAEALELLFRAQSESKESNKAQEPELAVMIGDGWMGRVEGIKYQIDEPAVILFHSWIRSRVA